MTSRILFFLSVIWLLGSCNNSPEYVSVKSLDGNWDKKTALHFNYDIKDSQNPKNIIFVVRNNDDYPYGNIRIIASISNLRSKKKEIDTLNYILAKPNGEWIGEGFGTTKETLFQYKDNYQFSENGAYTISVLQAMRQDNLEGIEDFGIKIEPAKPKKTDGK